MRHTLRRSECQNLLTGFLGRNYDQGAGVRTWHTGEDTGVNDEDVVCAVDLGVQIDDCASACATAVGTDLCCAEPVVGAAGADVCVG
jgi:hypothetical protein